MKEVTPQRDGMESAALEVSAARRSSLVVRDLPSVLRARKWTIVSVAAVVLTVALLLSFRQTPVYESSASVLVRVPNEGASPQQPNMATEKKIAGSTGVAEMVIERLQLATDAQEVVKGLSVQVPVDTEILEFHYTHQRPHAAQRTAHAFAETYLEYRRQQLLDALVASQRSLQTEKQRLTEQLSDVERRTAEETDENERAVLRAQAASLITQIGILQQQLAALTPPDALSAGEIVEPATLPAAPARPNHVQNALLGVVVGLTIGFAAALVREYADNRIRGREDIEARLGIPVLGAIPRVRGPRASLDGQLITASQAQSPTAEALRRLGANLLFAATRAGAKTVLVTSSGEEEGKTRTAANLGVVLASAGKRTILVSADLHKPRLEQLFGLSRDVGLANLLANEASVSTALRDTGIANLCVLPSGSTGRNPTELLTAGGVDTLIRDLRRLADFVLIDSPPLLPVADAAILAPACDAVLFVADARSATRNDVAEAGEQLQRANAAVLGAVLVNARPQQAPRAYGYR